MMVYSWSGAYAEFGLDSLKFSVFSREWTQYNTTAFNNIAVLLKFIMHTPPYDRHRGRCAIFEHEGFAQCSYTVTASFRG